MLSLTINKKEIVTIITPSGEKVDFKISEGATSRQVTLIFDAKKEIIIKRRPLSEADKLLPRKQKEINDWENIKKEEKRKIYGLE